MSEEELAMVWMGSDTTTESCTKMAGSCRHQSREKVEGEEGASVDRL